MHFSVTQPLEVSREEAEQAMVDPDFYASLGAMDNIGTPQVLAIKKENGTVRLSVRYRFTGHLARPARAILDPDKMTWVIESVMHFDQQRVEFTMLPDHYADRLECSGEYRFQEDGTAAVQVIDGDLRAHVPVVAGAVERAIIMGLRQHMTEQAKLLSEWAKAAAHRTSSSGARRTTKPTSRRARDH
ncbi:MAG TPA: DUF2505 family protein [Acidimicrobiales bacterium]|nr:DUF2505 family protein [Acidimicrobiales bacterium]